MVDCSVARNRRPLKCGGVAPASTSYIASLATVDRLTTIAAATLYGGACEVHFSRLRSCSPKRICLLRWRAMEPPVR